MRWREQTVGSDGVRLSVRDSEGDGRALLLIHGLGLTQRSWGRLAGRLRRRFRVVTFDQRSHGTSSRGSEHSPDAFLRDLEAVIRELRLQGAVLVGHSLGAHLAVEYASGHPECPGVIGIEGGVHIDLPAADLGPVGAGHRRLMSALSATAARLLRAGSVLSFDEMKRLVEEGEPWLRGLAATYKRIRCPVLLLMGTRPDRIPQGEEIREAVHRSVVALQDAHQEVQVEWLPCGHFPQLERPAEVAASIERFVAAET